MQEFILKLLNMSIAGSIFILAVMFLRLVLRKAPKSLHCLLWALAGFRLVCPFSLRSAFSLIPPTVYVSGEGAERAVYPVTELLPPADPALSVQPQAAQNGVSALDCAFILWTAGVLALAAWGIVGSIRLRRRIGASVRIGGRTFACDDIASPFILGIVRPRIYVPSALSGDRLKCVEAHENAHLARLDHLSKPLGFAVLCLHWFNPLTWAAYSLFCRDIELACDERVIRDMAMDERKFYSATLLECSMARRSAAAYPLAFGEVGVKKRVKNVLKFKKPTAFILAAAIVVCIAVGVFFLTDPPSTAIDSELDAAISQMILERNAGHYKQGDFVCEAHTVLAVERSGDETTVYAAVMYQEYSLRDGAIMPESGGHIPTAITVRKTEDGYELVEYWQSDDGTRYVPSIRDKFPWYAEDRAIRLHTLAPEHDEACIRQAEEFFGVKYVDPFADLSTTTTAVTAE